jgi:hypothetical protein
MRPWLHLVAGMRARQHANIERDASVVACLQVDSFVEEMCFRK